MNMYTRESNVDADLSETQAFGGSGLVGCVQWNMDITLRPTRAGVTLDNAADNTLSSCGKHSTLSTPLPKPATRLSERE